MHGLSRSPVVPPGLSVHKCRAARCASLPLTHPSTAASALCESSPPQLPMSDPPSGLNECFFFNSLVVRLPYSLIFGKFWLFFVFEFVVVLLLVVQGSKMFLPTPPFWPEVLLILIMNNSKQLSLSLHK